MNTWCSWWGLWMSILYNRSNSTWLQRKSEVKELYLWGLLLCSTMGHFNPVEALKLKKIFKQIFSCNGTGGGIWGLMHAWQGLYTESPPPPRCSDISFTFDLNKILFSISRTTIIISSNFKPWKNKDLEYRLYIYVVGHVVGRPM